MLQQLWQIVNGAARDGKERSEMSKAQVAKMGGGIALVFAVFFLMVANVKADMWADVTSGTHQFGTQCVPN